MNDIRLSILEALGMAWWIEVKTENPSCIYYFGPFLSETEAIAQQKGYLEDLEQEGATNISLVVKRCKPNELTIVEASEKEALGKLLLALENK
jgi:hypothetical protein